MKKYIQTALILLFINISVFAQLPKSIDEMTKEDVMALTYDELLELPFEDVLKLADIVGVSMDELYEMLLNKDVVSASKKAESSFEAPLSTSVISYDEIVSSGARNIPEALRLVPGVIVREKTNGNYDVHIRGNDNLPNNNLTVYSENSLTLVMINNRPVYNYVNGGTLWESLPVGISDIDRIEVVRGPASALYGANAVSGVINIITKKPDDESLQVYGQAQAGTLSTYTGSLSVGQKIGKAGYRISGNYQTMDRTTDQIYVFSYDSLMNKEDLQDLKNPTMPWVNVFDPGDDIDVVYEDPSIACNLISLNGNFYYDMSEDVYFSLSGGYQNSYVNSSSFGDPPASVSGREVKSTYIDFVAKVKGFELQVNELIGNQDIVKGDTGFQVDNNTLNAMLEYNLEIGNLTIRPGVAYQKTVLDDTPYLTQNSEGNYVDGFLNQENEISSFASSLRFDYRLLQDKLRLIAALRMEKYNTNNDYYFPFQFMGSYLLNDENLVRFVYSRANKGPFMVDTYANYEWDRTDRTYPSYYKFNGNEDLKLAQMDMIELGYRMKPAKNIQIDIEAFASKTRDFSCVLPDSLTLLVSSVDSTNHALYGQVEVPAQALPEYVNLTFQNIDLESYQYGVSANIAWVVSEKLIVKAFGTYQYTKLKNYTCYNNSDIVSLMANDAVSTFSTTFSNINGSYGGSTIDFFEGAGYESYAATEVYTTNSDYYEGKDTVNTATPSFYGGFSINYAPIEKIGFFLSGYYYSKQEFASSNGVYTIDPKLILSCKLSYKIWKENTIFLNARNLLNSDKQEFAWLDNTQGVYLIGLDINF